ncbi:MULTISPECIES: phosphoadenosine phosphosulfate reductase family protein [Cyanophyceae]|jgi:3'-phosphoadenosine 5'-phosphosulfate sulfotransferase (PAPS reductase)/FAD synthetase|uniref:Phosphoadenosine phosphosulfate reductase family protein n=1 Tax=Phormidium tenue FACHB-1050 TaxID=2692857 RepID=A0ABR8C6S1_9CYAN|nr:MULTISPECIES: phosphoadenosine phosphosulfate reductase family protein [Cyanophyceae]MBD2316359.1 phosphoadenosine phosphosulfate reductase family protein [Phormidium tenue FACHB-1050]
MTRHILGLSGGKDSTALAILMHKEVPQMEYFFCDTGKELPETYEYLERIKARLGIKIEYLNAERDFDHWLEVFNGVLPSPRVRWCTRKLKIEPLEKFVGDDKAISYIGIRADENREGYVSAQPNIYPIYPFKERSLIKADILQILDESGIGLPSYYEWRSRSGCSFCFFQRKYEWVKLAEKHPEEFAQAVAYERDHKDGRTYTWTQGETLLELIARKNEIIAEHEKALTKEKKISPQLSLAEVLESVLDDEDDEMPCLACHL